MRKAGHHIATSFTLRNDSIKYGKGKKKKGGRKKKVATSTNANPSRGGGRSKKKKGGREGDCDNHFQAARENK